MPEFGYNLTDYEYDLPAHFIAQEPSESRDQCKLLVLDKKSGEIIHTRFYKIIDFLRSDDVLVVNDTRVIPARLLGRKESGGQVEVFLLNAITDSTWKALVRPARRFKKGNWAYFGDNEIQVKVLDELEKGARLVEIKPAGDAFFKVIDKIGHIPLPPYIKRQDRPDDRINYQTVYSKKRGSVAAPTAGLHFSEALLEKIKAKGVKIVHLTLHIGMDTFRPVDCEDIRAHRIHSEYFEIDSENAAIIETAKRKGQRIIGVGTTSVRTLETASDNTGKLTQLSGFSNLYIYPGYKFKIVDAIITNFHLPKSSLMIMISAFSSVTIIKKAYEEAKQAEYRFFSYGDAMFIQ